MADARRIYWGMLDLSILYHVGFHPYEIKFLQRLRQQAKKCFQESVVRSKTSSTKVGLSIRSASKAYVFELKIIQTLCAKDYFSSNFSSEQMQTLCVAPDSVPVAAK